MWIIKRLQELKTNLILGLINIKKYNEELDELLEKVDNIREKRLIASYRDVDI